VVCVCVQNIWKSYEQILMISSRNDPYVLGTNQLAFGEDPDSLWILDHFPGFFTISS